MNFGGFVRIEPSLSLTVYRKGEPPARLFVTPVLTDRAVPALARICFWIAGWLRRIAE